MTFDKNFDIKIKSYVLLEMVVIKINMFPLNNDGIVKKLAEIRKLLDDNGGQNVKIISKIESQEGIDNFEEILELSDGIMVARGDMAVEVPFEQVPVVQKRFIRRCNEVGKPVITATQMLESMSTNPRATRAEVSDVANAVYDRTGAIMLSGESAMGKHPDLCVKTMDKISKAVEEDIKYWKRFSNTELDMSREDIKRHVAYIATATAKNLKADAIIAYTHEGNSARRLAGMGPECPILAITDDEKTYHQLGLSWNVFPVLVEGKANIDETIEDLSIKQWNKQMTGFVPYLFVAFFYSFLRESSFFWLWPHSSPLTAVY